MPGLRHSILERDKRKMIIADLMAVGGVPTVEVGLRQ